MIIKWKIEKKRGNLRPSLSYRITLEDYEKELAVPTVHVETLIPEIPDAHQNYCMPETNERKNGWEPSAYHHFSTPYFKDGEITGFIRLPLRDSNDYPDVEASFRMLRDRYEQVLKEAYDIKPFSAEESLEISDETRSIIAAGVAASRMLGFAGLS